MGRWWLSITSRAGIHLMCCALGLHLQSWTSPLHLKKKKSILISPFCCKLSIQSSWVRSFLLLLFLCFSFIRMKKWHLALAEVDLSQHQQVVFAKYLLRRLGLAPDNPLYLSAATSPKGTKIPTLPILKSLYTQLPCPVWLFLRMVLVKEWEFVQFSFLSLQCGWYPGITGLQDSVSTRIGSTSTAVVGFGCDYSKCLDEQFCRLDSESAEVSLDVLQCLSQVLHFHALLLLSVLLLSPGDPAPLRLPALQQSCERGWRF